MQQPVINGFPDIALLVCSGFLLFVNEHFCRSFVYCSNEKAADTSRLWPKVLGVVLRGASWAAAWMLRLPLAALYLLLFVSGCLSCKALIPKAKRHALFWGALFFSSCVFWHTSALAVITLFRGNTLAQTYRTYYILLMFLAELFMAIVSYSFYHGKKRCVFARLVQDGCRFRQCMIFLLYAAAYNCFDSLLVQFELPYWQVPAFLLGSCILIAFQLMLFIMDTNGIIRLAAHKREYDQLEKQRVEQIKKRITLQNLAYRDSLTGAYNRRYAKEMLNSLQKDYPRITIAYIDVDGLKKVNDSYGHQMGDCYLCAAADCLNSVLHKADVLARIGGDEFLVISTGQQEADLHQALQRANDALRGSKQGVSGSFSFGVVETSGAELDINAVLHESDRRMYRQKTGSSHGEVHSR